MRTTPKVTGVMLGLVACLPIFAYALLSDAPEPPRAGQQPPTATATASATASPFASPYRTQVPLREASVTATLVPTATPTEVPTVVPTIEVTAAPIVVAPPPPPPPPPAPTVHREPVAPAPTGGVAEAIAHFFPEQIAKATRVAQCESGLDPHNKRNPDFRGLWQFSWGTWQAYGGTGDPADASAWEQTMRARMLYDAVGWATTASWPVCGHR